MNYLAEKNNKVFVSGEIVTEAEFSHEVYGEGFYEMYVSVKRLSGQGDILPVTISERLISDRNLKVGVTINALGQFRSYNKLVDGKSKLMLTVFVRELLDDAPMKNPNSIVLSGYICKPPIYRTTPFNREIAEKIAIAGRIQSREYQKKITDDEIKTLTAYEVSISKLSAYENAENFDTEEEFNILGFCSESERDNIYSD